MTQREHAWCGLAAIGIAVGFSAATSAQAPPTVSVERDGDTFYVQARASVSVDPRIVWETITDYERMREFMPNIERSRVVARSGTRVIVEHQGHFPLFFFDVPVRVRLAVQQQPYERIVARSEPGDVDGSPQTLRSFAGSYDLTVISFANGAGLPQADRGPPRGAGTERPAANTPQRRAGVRLDYQSRFELAEPLPPIIGDLFGRAMVTKTVRAQFEAMLREMVRRQASRAPIEKSQ